MGGIDARGLPYFRNKAQNEIVQFYNNFYQLRLSGYIFSTFKGKRVPKIFILFVGTGRYLHVYVHMRRMQDIPCIAVQRTGKGNEISSSFLVVTIDSCFLFLLGPRSMLERSRPRIRPKLKRERAHEGESKRKLLLALVGARSHPILLRCTQHDLH